MKIKLTKKTACNSLIFMTLLAATQAQAALVDFSVSGQINASTEGNPWGLSVDDMFTASGQFDDSNIASGIIDFTSAINNMSITFGNTVYTGYTEVLGGANMYFTASGVFDGIDYLSISSDPGFTSSGYAGSLTDVYGEYNVTTDLNGNVVAASYVDGTWDVNSYTSAPAVVPVPAAIWLFASGLIGLAGIGRHYK